MDNKFYCKELKKDQTIKGCMLCWQVMKKLNPNVLTRFVCKLNNCEKLKDNDEQV